MDNICTRCGELWFTYCQVEDKQLPKEEQEFTLNGIVIVKCPSCKDTPSDDPDIQAYKQSGRGHEIAVIGEMLGDDLDGMVSSLEDFGLA